VQHDLQLLPVSANKIKSIFLNHSLNCGKYFEIKWQKLGWAEGRVGPEGVAASLEYRMKHLNAFQPKPTTRRLHCRPVALSNEITHTPRMPAAIIRKWGGD